MGNDRGDFPGDAFGQLHQFNVGIPIALPVAFGILTAPFVGAIAATISRRRLKHSEHLCEAKINVLVAKDPGAAARIDGCGSGIHFTAADEKTYGRALSARPNSDNRQQAAGLMGSAFCGKRLHIHLGEQQLEPAHRSDKAFVIRKTLGQPHFGKDFCNG